MARKTKIVTISLEPELLQQIDRAADNLDMPRSVFIRNLILVAMDDYKFFENIGLVSFFKKVQSVRKKIVLEKMGVDTLNG